MNVERELRPYGETDARSGSETTGRLTDEDRSLDANVDRGFTAAVKLFAVERRADGARVLVDESAAEPDNKIGCVGPRSTDAAASAELNFGGDAT